MSAIDDLTRRQQELEIEDDLSEYVGKWVAIRHGRVVAHDLDAARLAEQPGVEPGDLILAVGTPAGGYSFL